MDVQSRSQAALHNTGGYAENFHNSQEYDGEQDGIIFRIQTRNFATLKFDRSKRQSRSSHKITVSILSLAKMLEFGKIGSVCWNLIKTRSGT